MNLSTPLFQTRLPILCLIVSTLILLTAISAKAQEPEGYYKLYQAGEASFEKGDFAQCVASYRKAEEVLYLSAQTLRWIRFRLNDCIWRAIEADSPELAKEAVIKLEPLIKQDRLYGGDDTAAAVTESIGDYYWTRNAKEADWSKAWKNYQSSLNYWRRRNATSYLRVISKIAAPQWQKGKYSYEHFANWIPVEYLSSAIELASTPKDRALMLYLKGKTLAFNDFTGENDREIFDDFNSSIVAANPMKIEAMFDFAQWLDRSGSYYESGKRKPELSRIKALQLYDTIVRSNPADNKFVEQAQKLSDVIRRPYLKLVTSNILPSEKVVVSVAWANLPTLSFDITAVDLFKDLQLTSKSSIQSPWFTGDNRWFNHIDSEKLPLISRFTESTSKAQPFFPAQKDLELKQSLPPGAYILETENKKSRELFTISELLISRSFEGKTMKVLVSSLKDGYPLEGADVAVWEKHSTGLDGNVYRYQHKTDIDGIATFNLVRAPSSPIEMLIGSPNYRQSEILVTVKKDKDQAFFAEVFSGQFPDGFPHWESFIFTSADGICPGRRFEWRILTSREKYFPRDFDRFDLQIIPPVGKPLPGTTFRLDPFLRARGYVTTAKRWVPGIYNLRFEYRNAETDERDFVGSREFLVLPNCN